MILSPIPHGAEAEHGEGGGPAGVEMFAVGMLGQTVVYIDHLTGQGYSGSPRRSVGMVVQPSAIPPLPDDDDFPGWDAWAATIRDAAQFGVQQTLFGE